MMGDADWQEVTSQIDLGPVGREILLSAAEELSEIDPRSDQAVKRIRQVRVQMLGSALECGEAAQELRVCVSVFSDLRAQRWGIRVRGGAVELRAPQEAADPMEEKARVRAGLLVERDQQLRRASVRRFVTEMERQRIGPSGEWTSIFSLMRDGRDLADRLKDAREEEPESKRVEALRTLIQPYVQVVDDSTCPHTGLGLKDIWRYFRYTWSSPHKTLPGRNLWLLIRDAAVERHPVIGIAALGSAVVQLGIRDEWIGWTRDQFIEQLKQDSGEGWGDWVADRLQQQLNALYVEDLYERGVVEKSDLISPTQATISSLKDLARDEREKHRLYGSSREHKSPGQNPDETDWEQRALTPLFVSKRASTLADVLEDRLRLRAAGFDEASGGGLIEAASTAKGRNALARILRRTKAAHVGIDILDITVCGAVAPYNPILGGKLVSLLLASPEIRDAYAEKYGDRSSVIASSMAGRPVRRKPNLVLLGTTSLYGVGSSQYNRLRLPAEKVGGDEGEEIRYQERGVTEGYGSFHFSRETLAEIRKLYAQTGNGRRVKHIFGEGANPRMREVREALDGIGLPSDRLLRHGSSRVVYSIPLATNFREVLTDRAEDPDYIVPGSGARERTQAIADFWIERWLAGRIMKDRILEAVARHEVSFPVDHGARVPLPVAHDQMPLFAPTPQD